MSPSVLDLFEKASTLTPEDRATLAGLLIESLETELDEGVEEAWSREVERRMADFRAGKIKTVPWEEVRAKLRRRTSE